MRDTPACNCADAVGRVVQALVSLQHLEQSYGEYAYYMHADDDSYVRLDLLLQLLVSCWPHSGTQLLCQTHVCVVVSACSAPLMAAWPWRCLARAHTQAASPRQRFYWGYVWNRPGNPTTSPIRNPRNKSHMPYEQVGVCALVACCHSGGAGRRTGTGLHKPTTLPHSQPRRVPHCLAAARSMRWITTLRLPLGVALCCRGTSCRPCCASRCPTTDCW